MPGHDDSDTRTPAGVRQRNLARILNLVHVDGPLSRASLTAATGLNRSTVADLVEQLTDFGLVTERAPDPSGRVGRPSRVVAAAADVVAIAVNPEIDAVEIAAVALDRSILARERIDCARPPTPHEVAKIVAARMAAWRTGALEHCRVMAVGVAVPGLVGADGLVRDAPHLGWRDEPVRDLVEAATSRATVVGNDAGMGTWAEHLFGAGRGIDDLVYLNGGASGIGGGVIVNGMPVGGVGGYAGEFGQNRPGIADDADRRAAGGVLEDEVNRARLLDAVGLRTADEATLASALAAGGGETGAELARQRRILATALANAVNVLNPAVVVLGGFLATLATDDPDDLAAAVRRQSMPASAENLIIRVAALGENRLLIGAAESAFAGILARPTDVATQ